MNEVALSLEDCYENLGNQIIVKALEDYLVGEKVLEKSEAQKLSRRDMDKIRHYESSRSFLYSDRLAFFTKIPPETLIAAARKSDKIKAVVNKSLAKVVC